MGCRAMPRVLAAALLLVLEPGRAANALAGVSGRVAEKRRAMTQVEVAHGGSFRTDSASELMLGSPLVRLGRRDIYTSLDQEVKASGFPQRLLEERPKPSAALEEVCVAQPLGGSALAGNADFQKQAQRGHAAAASKSVIFSGLLRDIGGSASQLFSTLRKVGESFARYHIIVLENNSKDDTRKGLEKECGAHDTWCFELDMPTIAKRAQDEHNPSHMKNLVMLRQSLLEQVRKFVHLSPAAGPSWDFLVSFDGDLFGHGSQGFHPSMFDALLGFPVTGSKSDAAAVYAEAPYDIVCANQIANYPGPGRYRDTFALRKQNWNEGIAKTNDRKLYYTGNQLVPVVSCFSGLALYSMHAVVSSGCNYNFESENTCEHLSFHRCLANAGFSKTAIFPPLTNNVNDKGVAKQSCLRIGERAPVPSALEIEATQMSARHTPTRISRKHKTYSKSTFKQNMPMKAAPTRHSSEALTRSKQAHVKAQRTKALKSQLKPKTMKRRR